MPDVPESAAAEAMCELHHLDPEWARTLCIDGREYRRRTKARRKRGR